MVEKSPRSSGATDPPRCAFFTPNCDPVGFSGPSRTLGASAGPRRVVRIVETMFRLLATRVASTNSPPSGFAISLISAPDNLDGVGGISPPFPIPKKGRYQSLFHIFIYNMSGGPCSYLCQFYNYHGDLAPRRRLVVLFRQ